MNLSHRITHIVSGGSDGWEVFIRARQMVAAGQPVTELTIGEHDVRTDPVILDAMNRAAIGGHTGYASVPGTDSLRAAVGQRLTERTGVPTGPENILITAGGQAALFAAHHAVCDEGDSALFIDPYYTTYPGSIRSVGALPVPVKAQAKDDFQPDPQAIDDAVASVLAKGGRAKSLLVNSPNNPTGVVYSRKTLEGIAEVAKARDLWLISDEVYDTQVWEGEHLSPRAINGMTDRTLVIGSMSKSHAMTGSRCGWIAGPADAIGHLTNLSTNTNYGVAGFVQDAAEFALAQGSDLEEKVAAPFRRRRALAKDILAGQNVLRLVPAGGAMYLMLDLRQTGLSGEEFANRLLDERAIAVMPGESFGEAAAGHIRVAMTVSDDQFAQALRTVVQFAGEIAA